MFESQTYENLLSSALSRVSGKLDKREGSMIMNGVAPSMAELAQLYIALDFVLSATTISTMPREYLIERAMERGMSPKPASAAVFRAEFNIDVPVGARFSCEDLNFVITEKISDDVDCVSYKAECETAGTLANGYAGNLIPIDYVPGLTHAELTELLIPGDDDEDTEVFRRRFLDSFESQSFGGNRADYIEKVSAMPGVGSVKVRPVWNGGISPSELIPNGTVKEWYDHTMSSLEGDAAAWLAAVFTAASEKLLTVGGTVKLIIMAANNTVPSEVFISDIQTAVDPEQNAGEGLGLAPMGHVVSISGVIAQRVDITLNLTYADGWDWPSAQSYIEKVIDDYFNELAGDWANTDCLVVRISQIESRILASCKSIITDISNTSINGVEENLTLPEDSIPVRGIIYG